jgi:hypothetical protein
LSCSRLNAGELDIALLSERHFRFQIGAGQDCPFEELPESEERMITLAKKKMISGKFKSGNIE